MQVMIAAAAACLQLSSQQRPKISWVSLFPKKAYLQWENFDLMH
jgi:hypothetical protein